MLQAHVHGDERSAEDKQQDGDVDDAGRISRRSKDSRGIPESGPQQVNLSVLLFDTIPAPTFLPRCYLTARDVRKGSRFGDVLACTTNRHPTPQSFRKENSLCSIQASVKRVTAWLDSVVVEPR